jgi:hypothetical protein
MPGAVCDENGSEVARNVRVTSSSPAHRQGQWTGKPVDVLASHLSDWTNPGLQPPWIGKTKSTVVEKTDGQGKSFAAGTRRDNNFLAKYPRIGPESPLS